MSVAKMSCPQFLDAPLWPPEEPVDIKTVGVGGHLRRDPGAQTHQRLGQRPVHAEDTLEGREAHLNLLAYRCPSVGPFGRQQDAALSQLFSQLATAVGQISQEPPRDGGLVEASLG